MIQRLLIVFLLLNAHCLTLGQSNGGNETSTEPIEPSLTTSTTTRSTTEAPSTTKPSTTPAPPSTTSAPTPTPAPQIPDKFPKNIGNWTVVDSGTNVTCILFKGALDVVLSVTHKETNKTSKVEVYVPGKGEKKAMASGKCGEHEQEMNLTWTVESKTNELHFSFVLNKTGTGNTSTPLKYHLDKITGSIYTNTNTSELVKFTLENLSAHPVPQSKSYKCNSEEVLKTKGSNVEIRVANAQIEAFRNSMDATKYGVADECAADGYVADIVPIAVGCSLAGLVIIVLIAYLFGRRRARARGYQSV